jgi:hypothetical protein
MYAISTHRLLDGYCEGVSGRSFGEFRFCGLLFRLTGRPRIVRLQVDCLAHPLLGSQCQLRRND